MGHTKLQLPCPNGLRRVGSEALCEVALNTADHVMAPRLSAYTDDPERVVLQDRGAADPAEKALLHTALEFEDGDLGGWLWMGLLVDDDTYQRGKTYNLDFHGNLP